MKKIFFPLFLLLGMSAYSQVTMQGTIKRSATPKTVDIYVKPSASFSQKDEAMLFAMAIPAMILPAPSMGSSGVTTNGTGAVTGISGTQPFFLFNNLGATQREVVVTTETINGVAHYVYVFIFAGTASNNHEWVGGVEQRLFSIQFNGCAANCMGSVKLVSLPNGGSTSQGYWYFQSNTLGDINNYASPFYANTHAMPPVNGGSNTGAALSVIEITNVDLGNVVLPVKLTAFDATKKGCDIHVKWKTEHPLNVKKYEVEVSQDNINFIKLGEADAKNISDYNFSFLLTDKLKGSVIFIRIKSIDLDGSYSYSKTISVNGECNNGWQLVLYPNPANAGSVTIAAKEYAFNGKYKVSIFNSEGQLVHQKEIALSNAKTFSLSVKSLSSGKYHIQVSNREGSQNSVLDFEKL